VRHGETIWNIDHRMQGHKNSPLTEIGKQQAAGLRKKMISKAISAAYTSTLKRAKETAKIILGNSEVPLIERASLNEINLGEWEGKTYAEVKKLNLEQFNNFWKFPTRYSPSSGETYHELQSRAIPEIYRIFKENAGRRVLIVSHWITIKIIYMHFNKIELDEIAKVQVVGNGSYIKIEKKGEIFSTKFS
jgi:phosphoserine phosphatase